MLQPWAKGGQNRRNVHLFAQRRSHFPQLALAPNENSSLDKTKPPNQPATATQVQTVQSFLREMLQL